MDKLPRLPWALGLWVEVIDLDKHLDDLMSLEQACFPESMRESHASLAELFEEHGLVGLILYSKGRPIATLSGVKASLNNIPSEAMLDQLAGFGRVFYMENICVHPDYRSAENLLFMFQEMKLRISPYFDCVSGAARVSNGWSQKLQAAFRAKVLGRFEDWQGFCEPFEFVVIDLSRVPVSPAWIRRLQLLLGKIARIRF